jgi:Zn-dependent peptidase ImmA (M78 family)/transcriptional regulator with XRE-family HTH domain
VPTSPRAVVTPSALRWARESVGFTVEEAARRIGVSPERLEQAEQGDHFLTMRQAETAARQYDRPLAALFMPEPPTEEPVETQFRRLPGAPPPPWPHEMRLLIRRVRERQEAAADLYELLEEPPPWTTLDLDFGGTADDPARLAARLRETLGVPLDEQKTWLDRSGYKPLRAWVDAVEAVGVHVMQDGTMPVDLMRGFASTHPQAPAIVVNSQDDPRARAFTAIHELGHLLRVRAGLPTGPTTEGWCDDLAGHVLLPPDSFAADFRRARSTNLLEQVDRVALTYGVTPYAAAVRASRLRLAARDELDEVIERIRDRATDPGGGAGGDYYRTKVSRLGPAFVGLVFAALDTQAVSEAVASGLLREKVNHLPTLREYLVARR